MASERLQRLDEQLGQLEQHVLQRAQQNVQATVSAQSTTINTETPALMDQHGVVGSSHQRLQNWQPTQPLPPAMYGALSSLNSSGVLQTSHATNRLVSSSGLGPPGPAKSTWEADKARALLAMEDKMRKLQTASQAVQQSDPSHDAENIQPHSSTSLQQADISSTHHASVLLAPHSGSYGFRASANTPHVGIHDFTVRHHHQLGISGATGMQSQQDSGAASNLLARARPGTAGQSSNSTGTWERSQAQALLMLERERDNLVQQLSQYSGLNAIHQQQLMTVHAKHAKALQDAQGDAGRKLHSLSLAAASACAARRLSRHLGRALVVWRHEARRTRRLRWAERLWDRRTLEPLLKAWATLTQHARRPIPLEVLQATQQSVLNAWHLHTTQQRRLRHLGHRCAAARLHRLLHAWRLSAHVLCCKHTMLGQAQRHYQHGLVMRGFMSLVQAWQWAVSVQSVLELKLHRVRVRAAFKAWHRSCTFSRRVACLLHRTRTLHVLHAWRDCVRSRLHLRTRVATLSITWSQRRRRRYLQLWAATAQWLIGLRHSEEELEQMTRSRYLARVFRRLWQSAHVQRMQTRQERRLLASSWHGWWQHTCRAARGRRVAAAAGAARLLRLGRGALAAWTVLGASRKARLQADNLTRMEVYVSQLQGETEEARTEMFAALGRARAYREQAAALQHEASRSLLLGHAGGLVGTRLQWEAVNPPPGAPAPAPLMRHCTHWLPAIQPPATCGPSQQGEDGLMFASRDDRDPDVSVGQPWITRDVLVVFGGVSGEQWLTDVNALVITHAEAGPSVAWVPLPLDTRSLPGGRLAPVTGWASCTAGPSSWVVLGGFDGTTESMDMYLFQVHLHEPRAASEAEPHDPLAGGLSVSVQLIPVRSPRSPPGRTDHCVAHHERGRCLLVFGGYSSQSGGCLADMWVFDMDTSTWWQPEPKGVWPGARRGHAAALVGDELWVHGGFDGSAHMCDLWRCNTNTWTWTAVSQMGIQLTGRRGHACTGLEGRYLLVTGGYDGNRHLADVAVLDTHTGMWQHVEATGGGAPAPCALHTLTLAGSSCVQLGGCGALGAVSSVHLLQSPALGASQAQQQQLVDALEQLAGVTGRAAELQAHLEQADWRQQEALRHAKTMEERCAEVAQQYNQVVEDVQSLQATLSREQGATQQARARAQAAEVAAAAAERRLARAREGGKQVADAAGQLQHDLMAADVRLDQQECELEELRQQCAAVQALNHQLTAERNLMHVQLATANNETNMLRALMSRTITADAGPAPHHTSRQEPTSHHSHHSPVIEASPAVGQQTAASTQGQLGPGTVAAATGADASLSANNVAEAAGLGQQQQLEALQSLLVQERVRAATAEGQLRSLEAEHAAQEAAMGALRRQVAKEVAAAQSSRCMAEAALSQLRAGEVHHAREVEELTARLRTLQAKIWEMDMQDSEAALASRDQPWSARQPPPSDSQAMQALMQLVPGSAFLMDVANGDQV